MFAAALDPRDRRESTPESCSLKLWHVCSPIQRSTVEFSGAERYSKEHLNSMGGIQRKI